MTQVLGLLFVVLCGALTEFALAPMLGGGTVIYAASGLLAKVAADPQAWQKWEKLAFKQGEYKTEFNESEIGYTFADDGPKPSQRVAAAPILYHQELKNGGHKVSIRYKNPVFSQASEVLNKGRYHDQVRMGAEHKLDLQHVQAIVDKWHFGLREDDLEGGQQITANMGPGDVMKSFVDELTDHEARKKDTGMFFAMFAGFDTHHFINAALRAGTSNGAVPVADAAYGLLSTMSEHPNTFVWHKTGSPAVEVFEKIAYSATPATFAQNINVGVSKITGAAVPTLNLLNRINRQCISSSMIPCRIRLADGKMHEYFLVYVPGKIKDLLEQDERYFKLMTEAHQGIIDKNPLLKSGDVMYKRLIIRESPKLDDEYFSVKSSFGAVSATNNTASAFNLSGTPQEASITPGTRTFVAASAGLTDLGVNNTQLVGRILVLGANAGIRAIGKSYSLERMEVTDYKLNDGVGWTKMYGQQRVAAWKVDGSGLAYEKTPQSFQVLCFQGD